MSAHLVEAPRSGLTERHDHSWALQAVTHEDGDVLEEYGCAGCGELTFR